jgi:7-cyano-7-deazaguanine synthase
MAKAILLSGGIDSIALAYWQRPDIAITIDYGQAPAQAEINASTAVASALWKPSD